MTQEIKVQAEQKQLANLASEWGGGQVVTHNDIVISKILPLNHMSEKVRDGQGKYGEFRDTFSNELFGNLETPFEVIPVAMEKKWLEFDLIAGKSGTKKREFKRVVRIVDIPGPDFNDNLPYAEEGIERDRCMDFYVLVPMEVAKGGAIPYVVSFKRTSLRAGKKLATQMFIRNSAAKKSPAAVVCTLSGKSIQNDDGEYVVQDVVPSREATVEEVTQALSWYRKIVAGQTVVQETGE